MVPEAPTRRVPPTFIVGMPRTGSKIYKNIINANTCINVSAEIFYLTPRWIRDDFVRSTTRSVGDPHSDASITRIVNRVFHADYFGTYFRDIRGDPRELERLMLASDRSWKGLFESLLTYDAQLNQKVAIGAKFPVHITRAQELLDWFPDARIIHINRHPLAIYNSQKRKHLKGRTGPLRRALIRIQILAATVLSYRASHAFFRRNTGRENYIYFQYEDLVADPPREVRRLCDFLGVPFDKRMLSPESKGSSYERDKGVGIHSDSIDLWRKEVSTVERWIFQTLTQANWQSPPPAAASETNRF
jgi:hypothetical protein